MVNFTKSQILVQAGTSMLAQAQQAPQDVLSLLRSSSTHRSEERTRAGGTRPPARVRPFRPLVKSARTAADDRE